MTDLLDLEPGDKVARLAQARDTKGLVGPWMCTVSRLSQSLQKGGPDLAQAGYADLNDAGDGYYGWEERSLDAIIVTAAPDHLLPSLGDQLTEDGRIVID
jgi:protein-L-isoaspartate(D-aspartate) O-methyltransferase